MPGGATKTMEADRTHRPVVAFDGGEESSPSELVATTSENGETVRVKKTDYSNGEERVFAEECQLSAEDIAQSSRETPLRRTVLGEEVFFYRDNNSLFCGWANQRAGVKLELSTLRGGTRR